MEWEHFNHFVDPDGLQGDGSVQPQDLAWDPQSGVVGGQDDFAALDVADTAPNFPSLPTLDTRARLPPTSTARGPMRKLGSRPPPTTFPSSTSRHLPPGGVSAPNPSLSGGNAPNPPHAATNPHLPRTRALARAKLMSNRMALRRAAQAAGAASAPTAPAAPAAPPPSAAVPQTLLHHINALQARVHALETHVDALNQTLERWDPDIWECLREMVQELCNGNGQAEGDT